ncbi:MAG TPA: N-acetylmuramoyl-L-alanine amidase [Terriglobales bacterium]|nr:N-acetylmuramoyl-L-alanine amidase [Terriglobales bacterium]
MTQKIAFQRLWRWSTVVTFLTLAFVSAEARVHHSDAWARDRFASAERMREGINGRPAKERTRREYQRVIDAYRGVYFGAPASGKADPSVVAAAELMVEMGRTFNDEDVLRSAIEQYRFLRKEYPGSKFRFDALFTVGEVYKDDLDDPAQAKVAFEEFIQRYPRHRLADDARQALAEISEETAKQHEKSKSSKSDSVAKRSDTTPDPKHREKTTRVTGIRHWSTPDYTRVAIDLEQDIKFDSQRIDNPDRIFFDLRDAKLASTLVGKSFEVDDGLLKKIRVAQFQPGRARVVLEVDGLSDYTAFLLPNPSRLIIDIHGKVGRQSARKLDNSGEKVRADAQSPSAGAQIDDDSDLKEVKAAAKADGTPSTASANDATQAVSPPSGPKAVGKIASKKKIVAADADEDDDDTDVTVVTPRKRVEVVKPSGESSQPAITHTDLPESPASRIAKGKSTKNSTRKTGARKKEKDEVAALDAREARPTSSGDRSLIRALGLKIGKIVIDAGHGGHDTGTIGPNGLEEKDLVLEVARRLGRLLDQRLGAEVVYTRQDDTFIPLETRTAIANRERADLFISIHANSSRDPAARGVETYYLNFTSSAEALEVAARENAVSEKSIYELQDLVKKIALKEKIEESREFASNVQQALHTGLSTRTTGMRDRGVKKAPFVVLIGANMPSILAEISFVSNPSDERKLETSEYRQRIAESLYRGIAKYANGLSGVKVASRLTRDEAQ